jgi:NAD(P)-dependent dehydrogenase (short-subunit alcohol dehydrogenase family)
MTQTTIPQFAAKNALITGGGTGIGRAAALALAAEACTVTVAGRTQARAPAWSGCAGTPGTSRPSTPKSA